MSILAGIDTAVGLGNMAYNMWANQRNRGDYLKQQRYANNFAENAVQIRRKDLEAAGLHPSLAAGHAAATPPVGSSAHHSVPKPDIMENALKAANLRGVNAQIDQTKAETDRIRNNILVDNERVRMEGEHLGLSTNADKRAGELHPGQKALQNIERQLKRAGIRNKDIDSTMKEVETAIKVIDHNYMSEHGMKMPSRDSKFAEVERSLDSLFFKLPSAVSDYIRSTISDYIGSKRDKPQFNPYNRESINQLNRRR
jgi:hypothetical protein